MRVNNFFKLIIAIAVSEVAGIIGSVFTMSAIPTWYAGLAKSSLNPPAWIFGPVWTTLFAIMGVAAWLIWKNGITRKDVKIALIIFDIQLILNVLWSIIFFGWHSPGWAFVEIIFLWIAILATIIIFAKISRPAAWLLAPYIIWVSFAGYLNFSIWQINSSANMGQVACTMEAKLCPDGSAVGRTGPKCEFAPCPNEGDNNFWKTITDHKTGATFQYPDHLLTEYIHTIDWPPKIQLLSESFACVEGGSKIAISRKTEKRLIDGRAYCVTKESEGAAGSIYANYTYAFSKNAMTIIFKFTLQATQCANYDEPRKTACEEESSSFDIDSIVDRMVKSIMLD